MKALRIEKAGSRVRAMPAGRRCKCGNRLSIYNRTPKCASCQRQRSDEVAGRS